MKRLIFICILSITFSCLAQVNPATAGTLDSLWSVWNDESQADTSRLKSLTELFDAFIKSESDSTLLIAKMQYEFAEKNGNKMYMSVASHNMGRSYAKNKDDNMAMEKYLEAKKISEEIGYKLGVSRALNNIATIYYYQRNYTTAIEYFAKKIKICEEIEDKQGKASALYFIGSCYYYQDNFDKAREYYQMSLVIYEEIEDKVSMANSIRSIGFSYKKQGDYNTAIEYCNKSLNISEKIDDKPGMGTSYLNLGILYNIQGDVVKAIDVYSKCLKISEEIDDKKGIASVLNNIGNIYYIQKDYDKAMEYYTKSLKIKEEIQDRKGISVALGNIGLIYLARNDYVKAKEYTTESMKIREELGDKNAVASILVSIGSIYKNQGNDVEAMEYFSRSLKIQEEIDDKRGMTSSIIYMGNIYFNQGNYRKAVSFGKRALELSRETGEVRAIKEASASLYKSYKKINRYGEALEMHELYIIMRDSIQSEENARAVISQEYEYNYEKTHLADSLLQKEVRLKADLEHQTQLSKKDRTRNILIGSGLFILLLAGGLYNRVRFINKSNAQLEVQKNNAETEKKRAERSEAFKQQFLANMSHEIRTPMNAVLGMTNLTLDTKLNELQSKYMTGVKKSSENLLVIINDILDLSKMEAGKMELEKIPFNLAEQIGQIHDTLRFKAEEKSLLFETKIDNAIPEVLIGDPSRLNQILINLCGNAIKFTNKGSVSLSVELIPGQGDKTTLNFKITDTGIGIPKDKAAQLFTAFQQVEVGTSRKYGGTGLGLSISQTLVELHGGTISIESEEGKGSEFSFSIDYEKAKDADIAILKEQQSIDFSALTGMRVLIAEDNEFNQIVINDTLLQLVEEVKIDLAENGKIALEKLETSDYNMILMDVNMPELDGLEATKAIRLRSDEKKNIPIIALTASVLSADINKCLDSGMNDYIPKPFRREELLSTLSKYYKKS